MKTRLDRTAVERVLRPAVVIDVGIYIVVALIGLLIGWRDLDSYGKALEAIGVILALAGGVSLLMGPTGVGSWTYQPPKGLDTGAHIARVFRSVPRGIGCSTMLTAAGIGALVPGLLLQAVGCQNSTGEHSENHSLPLWIKEPAGSMHTHLTAAVTTQS